MACAVKLKRHRELAAERADCGGRNRVNTSLLRRVAIPVPVLPLRECESTASAAKHYPNPAPLFPGERFRIQFCILERLPRRNDREPRSARHVRPFFGLKVLVRIQAPYFSRDLNGKL